MESPQRQARMTQSLVDWSNWSAPKLAKIPTTFSGQMVHRIFAAHLEHEIVSTWCHIVSDEIQRCLKCTCRGYVVHRTAGWQRVLPKDAPGCACRQILRSHRRKCLKQVRHFLSTVLQTRQKNVKYGHRLGVHCKCCDTESCVGVTGYHTRLTNFYLPSDFPIEVDKSAFWLDINLGNRAR